MKANETGGEKKALPISNNARDGYKDF